MTQLEAAVVDTDVFSLLFLARNAGDSRIMEWRHMLGGRRVMIAFQTRAEVLAGARERGWGVKRYGAARQALADTPTIPADDEVVDAFADLTAACRAAGHALQDRRHVADRWVAACAIAKELPLVSGDGIYENVPALALLV